MKRMRQNKRYLSVIAAVLTGAFLLAGCGSSEGSTSSGSANDSSQEEASEQSDSEETELLSGLHHVNILIQDKGTISVELDADAAPITVTNFIRLAESGFYDGVTFHRIIEGFMMQGGDPTGTGSGGSGENIIGEFAANGIDNPISHERGVISMARSQANNSASAQFFIMHQDGTYLDGSYAAFGHVTEGMDIVDDICENTTGQDENGIVPVENRPIITTIEVVD